MFCSTYCIHWSFSAAAPKSVSTAWFAMRLARHGVSRRELGDRGDQGAAKTFCKRWGFAQDRLEMPVGVILETQNHEVIKVNAVWNTQSQDPPHSGFLWDHIPRNPRSSRPVGHVSTSGAATQKPPLPSWPAWRSELCGTSPQRCFVWCRKKEWNLGENWWWSKDTIHHHTPDLENGKWNEMDGSTAHGFVSLNQFDQWSLLKSLEAALRMFLLKNSVANGGLWTRLRLRMWTTFISPALLVHARRKASGILRFQSSTTWTTAWLLEQSRVKSKLGPTVLIVPYIIH